MMPAIAAAPTGYAHPDYAASLSHIGQPIALPGCGGWLLERPIPGQPDRDAIGPYPLFACQDWSRLGSDLDALQGRLVTASLVADPLGGASPEDLKACFDVVLPFKKHYLADLSLPANLRTSAHHRRNDRLARRSVTVEHCPDGAALGREWAALYAGLVARHDIGGPAAFPAESLARQLSVPGMKAFKAVAGGETVCMSLWYVQGQCAYYHLSACTNVGYKLRAAFALMGSALNHLAGQARWANLGGAVGLSDSEDSGLARFKRGWATEARPAYFCGRILDPSRYAQLDANAGGSEFFPAYRKGLP